MSRFFDVGGKLLFVTNFMRNVVELVAVYN